MFGHKIYFVKPKKELSSLWSIRLMQKSYVQPYYSCLVRFVPFCIIMLQSNTITVGVDPLTLPKILYTRWNRVFSNHAECDIGFTYIISTIQLHHCGEWSELLIGFRHQRLIWPRGTIDVVFSFKRHVCIMQTRPLKYDGRACIGVMEQRYWTHLNTNTSSVHSNIPIIFNSK